MVGKKANAKQKNKGTKTVIWLWVVCAIFCAISIVWIVEHVLAIKKLDVIVDGVEEHREVIVSLTKTLKGFHEVITSQEYRISILESFIIAKGGTIPNNINYIQPGQRKPN